MLMRWNFRKSWGIKMKHSLWIVTGALLISGCTTTTNNNSVLQNEYSQYREYANRDNIIEVADDYFTPSLLGDTYKNDPDAARQLLFKDYMASTNSYYEKKTTGAGCLTVNGYDEDNLPLVFSIRYISNDDRWLIDEIHVVFVENEKDFSGSAKCPSEYST